MQQPRPWLCCAAIVVAGVALYGRTLGYGFVGYDDQQLLVALHDHLSSPTSALRGFYQDTFALLGPQSAGLFYRPVLIASFVGDASLAGPAPRIYHATNLILHLIASCLVFALLARRAASTGAALALALVYCAHPVMVPVAAWIMGRNESLLAIAAVSTLLFLLAFLERRDARLLPLVLAGFALTLLTKESGVVLAALLPLVVLVERRPEEGISRRLVTLGLAGGLVGLCWVAVRRGVLGDFPLAPSGIGENLRMLLVYVGKAFLPVQLSVYPYPADVSLLPGLLGLGLLGALLACTRRAWLGWAGIGAAWFLGFLAPTLVAAKATTGLEHRLALPLIGLLLLASQLRPSERLRPIAWAAGLAALTGLAAISWQRTPDYRDTLAFWESAVRSSPHAHRAWTNLGYRQLDHGLVDEAVGTGRSAVALKDDAENQLLLGVALARSGRLEEAEPALVRATELAPESAQAWRMLATLRQRQGRSAEAGRLLERARSLE